MIHADQVAATDLNGLQRKFLCDAVHHALPYEAHPRFTDATIGHDRALVGDDRPSFQSQVLDLVGVEQVVQLVREVDRQCADRAPDVVGVENLESQHLTIRRDRRFDVEFLLAGVPARHHVLAAIFDPFHRGGRSARP